MQPSFHRRKRRITKRRALVLTVLGGIVIIGIPVGVLALDRRAAAPRAVVAVVTKPSIVPTPPVVAPITFDKTLYSTTDPSSLWVVVNKQHPLSPIDYAPTDLVSAYGKQVSARMKPDLDALITDAAQYHAYLTLASGYRSYSYQQSLYASYIAADGQAKADTYSARPGYSEHQTGLAVDFGDRAGTCIVQECFASTAEGQWLAANAYKYGFLLRYTAEKQSVTGYEAEAWHYRYIGRPLAAELHSEGIATLEEFFGISGGEQYL